MIFDWDRVSCEDFGDCPDEIVVAGIDFIGRQLFCGLCLQWEGCFWEPPMRGQRHRVIDLIIDGREEDFKLSR
jgi:hypothetical protein